MTQILPSAAPPLPGPPALVDLGGPRAAGLMTKVRSRLATFGDPAIALRRAADAAGTATRILSSREHAMASALGLAGRPVAAAASLPEDRPLWILGDARGDALALAAALAFIDEADGGPGPAFVAVLGDWCGGAAGDAATAAMVLERFNAAPDRTILICGDRECLAAPVGDPTAPAAKSSADMPVAECHASLKRAWLETLASLVPLLPAAAWMPDGTMLAHGAVPRPSRLEGLENWQALQSSAAAIRDFTLGRLHAKEERIHPHAGEGGVVAGVCDFHASMAWMARMAERPMSRLVRGQDAAPEGHRWFRAYGEGRVLTLTTMADMLPTGGRRHPCVARLKGGRIRVVQLDVPEETAHLAAQLFPPLGEPSSLPARVAAQAAASVSPPAPPPVVEPVPPAAEGAAASFDQGVRLLRSRDWAGAREAFRMAATMPDLRDASLLNQAAACLWLGAAGHQDSLACLRQLRATQPRAAEVHLALGIAFLSGERNPSEAMRSLRVAVATDPEMADAWWALGLAAAMRHDAGTAAAAFARAEQGGCRLSPPASVHGGISARELVPVLDALRGLARCRASASGDCEPVVTET